MGKRVISIVLSILLIFGLIMVPEKKSEATSTWLTEREYNEYLKLQSKCPIEGTYKASGENYNYKISIEDNIINYSCYVILENVAVYHVSGYSVVGSGKRMIMHSGPYFGADDYVKYYCNTDVTTYSSKKYIPFVYYESKGITGRTVANNIEYKEKYRLLTEKMVSDIFMYIFSEVLKANGIDISKIGFRSMESTIPDEPDTPVTPRDSSNKNNDKSTPKYSNEWVNGKWYDADGKQVYAGTLQWKSNATGWWVEDTSGWYPTDKWQKIDGTWYYFKPNGYMAANEYYKGNWFNSNGSWDNRYMLRWKSDSTGWWVEDVSGWWPSSSWLKIDGYWYYFDASGYMVTNQFVDGYWIGADGVCW